MHDLADPTPLPWWRYGHVWLVIAGPAIVVVACMVTIWLAITRPDPVLGSEPPRREVRMSDADNRSQAASLAVNPARLPAVQARNHAATPAAVIGAPKP